MTLATAHKHITRRGIGYRGSNHFRGSERKTATRQMRDRVERIMKEGLACDCCSAEIKALFTEWIENRENTLKTKEIADKLIPLMEACGCDICKQLLGSAGAAVEGNYSGIMKNILTMSTLLCIFASDNQC